MKRKRFYNDKKRNEKWTEEKVGREIDFASKYDINSETTSKYSFSNKAKKKKKITKKGTLLFLKKCLVVVCAFAIVSVGYIIMDVHMERVSMPQSSSDNTDLSGLSDIHIVMQSDYIESLSLDGAIMLDAIVEEISNASFSSVTFDLKRDNGTIAYRSSLATIDTIGAISSPATDLKGSVKELSRNDVLSVGRISCYKDNILPKADNDTAVMKGSSAYRDSSGAMYLNPDNDSVYRYIKGIVEEASGDGVMVFLLDNTDLPEEIAGAYTKSGFETLATRLTTDLGQDIKFLKPVYISLTSTEEKAVKAEIDEKMANELDNNSVYTISCSDDLKSIVKQYIDEKGIDSYIIL